MLAATGDNVIFADADMATPPDMIPLLVGALPTLVSPPLGKAVSRVGLDLGRRSCPGHPVRLQRFPPLGCGRGVRATADHEHRVRRRGDLPRPPTRPTDRGRPDSLV
jgi:hypothetical protein